MDQPRLANDEAMEAASSTRDESVATAAAPVVFSTSVKAEFPGPSWLSHELRRDSEVKPNFDSSFLFEFSESL